MSDNKEMAATGGKFGALFTKVIATVFAAVVAPILVAVGVKHFNSPGPPKAESVKEKTADPPDVVKPPPGGNLIATNLADNFYSYGRSQEAKAVVRNDLVDSLWFRYIKEPPGSSPQPAIQILGREKAAAYLGTKASFANYTLLVWWRWGDKTYQPREDLKRWAAVLLHIPEGGDGQLGGVMPTCVTVHIREGQVGNIRLLGPEDAVRCKATVRQVPGHDRPVFDKDAPAVSLASTGAFPKEMNGQEWDGTIYRKDFREDKFDQKLTEADRKPTPWQIVQIDSDHGTVTVRVGAKVVNRITDCNLARGRIGITSQHADWYVGRMEVVPKSD